MCLEVFGKGLSLVSCEAGNGVTDDIHLPFGNRYVRADPPFYFPIRVKGALTGFPSFSRSYTWWFGGCSG